MDAPAGVSLDGKWIGLNQFKCNLLLPLRIVKEAVADIST